MLMTAESYRDSLRRYRPRVFVNGDRVESVADEARFMPGINAIGVTYDFAQAERSRFLMAPTDTRTGKVVNRFLNMNRSTTDLLHKLEAVRLVCQESGCAQRYLTQDALNAIYQATWRIDQEGSGGVHDRFLAYLDKVQDEDLTLGVAMTDAKGDRSKRPHEQANPNTYVHIKERRPDGIVIEGTKAIVTAAPYVH